MTHKTDTDRAYRDTARRLLVAAMDRAGVSGAELALRCGVSETQVSRWRLGQGPAPIHAVLALGPEGIRHAAASLMSEVAGSNVTAASIRAHARLVREVGELMEAHAAALENGRVDRTETPTLRAEALDAMAPILEILALCNAVDRNGVIGVHKAHPGHVEQEAAG